MIIVNVIAARGGEDPGCWVSALPLSSNAAESLSIPPLKAYSNVYCISV